MSRNENASDNMREIEASHMREIEEARMRADDATNDDTNMSRAVTSSTSANATYLASRNRSRQGLNRLDYCDNDTNDNSHNRDTPADNAQRAQDYNLGWLSESVYPPRTACKWARVVTSIRSRRLHGMQCFGGTYMAQDIATVLMPGDIVIAATESRGLYCYVFMMHGEWFSIDHLPIAWTGNWAVQVIRIIESWLPLSRALRIFRACNEAIITFQDVVNNNPELADNEQLTTAVALYTDIKQAATSRTGSLTMPLIRETVNTFITKLVTQTNTSRETVINLFATAIAEREDTDVTRHRTIVELRIEGLDQLINAVMMIFGAKIQHGSAVVMLSRALEAVQHNAGLLDNWVAQTVSITPAAWQKINQRSPDALRLLNRFNLRNRKQPDADR